MTTPFSVAAVARALLGAPVRLVEVVEMLDASTAQVARLRIHFFDGRPPLKAVGKSASGSGLSDAYRELRFFQQLAPLWANPAPRLLGFCTNGARDDARPISDGGHGGHDEHDEHSPSGPARLLLLMEDLGASGYALATSVSPAQLRGVVEMLVQLHARFWEKDVALALPPVPYDAPSVTRCAQAWPREDISVHAAAVRREAAAFRLEPEADAHAEAELSAAERGVGAPQPADLIDELIEPWEGQFLARVGAGRSLTLIHADFHLMGNVFFAAGEPLPRVIDWSEIKPGLAPHDVAYFLHAVPLEAGVTRLERDLEILRGYWEGLRTAGIRNYSWELCQWDFRFSAFAFLFQAVLQRSSYWYRKHIVAIDLLDARAALRARPPA